MKNRIVTKLSALVAGVVLLGQAASSVSADPAPNLPYGASEVLKLVNARVGDDTIVAYINRAPIGYNLTAADLVYLRNQGVSDSVMSAMLTHPRPAESIVQAPAPVAAPAPAPAPAPVVIQAPPTTVVQAAPIVVAAPPVVYDYGYYPYYYSPRPAISLSFGFGGGHYHGGYRGGYHGGYHGHR